LSILNAPAATDRRRSASAALQNVGCSKPSCCDNVRVGLATRAPQATSISASIRLPGSAARSRDQQGSLNPRVSGPKTSATPMFAACRFSTQKRVERRARWPQIPKKICCSTEPPAASHEESMCIGRTHQAGFAQRSGHMNQACLSSIKWAVDVDRRTTSSSAQFRRNSPKERPPPCKPTRMSSRHILGARTMTAMLNVKDLRGIRPGSGPLRPLLA